ncbi:hypothetical protein GHK29_34085 [Sinorhizobium medicae]|nr:hypothetical protein [Sinorhizobium medicae]MQU79464.1 hypothetical protein [Sinorhizobium medicae]
MQAVVSDWASHLFVDEAHHIAAKTWRALKQRFGQRPVLQFTATPIVMTANGSTASTSTAIRSARRNSTACSRR